jgi:peptide/nickel transport system substrate-binding protein
MKRFFQVLVLALFTVTLLAGSGGKLVMAIETEPVGLDPTLVTAFASHRVLENVYDGLLRYDESMNLVPNLAESFEVVDPYTIVFKLRDGVKFHSGDLLTPEDVIFTFERIMNPDIKAPAATYYKEVSSIKIVDDNKIEFKLTIPMAASLLPNFAGVNSSILSKKFVESGANLQLSTNGTGPFELADYVAGNYITLKRNTEYFIEGIPYLDEIKMMIMPEEVTRVSALKNGDVDLAKINEPLSLNQLPADRFKIHRNAVLSYYLLGINTTKRTAQQSQSEKCTELRHQ